MELTISSINPYWKLALVFKCLADNIMLDDFKSVLQRLGALKLDGSDAMHSNSLNMSPNEKVVVGGDEDEHLENIDVSPNFLQSNRRQRTSLSGRLLDDGEALDEKGQARRKQSIASSAVGKIGVKLPKLPGLRFIQSGAEREAKKNMERNKRISTGTSSVSDRHDSREEVPPWDRVDFITALNDSDPGETRPNR
jgi:hypothetical protein